MTTGEKNADIMLNYGVLHFLTTLYAVTIEEIYFILPNIS
jgi:hypothetical protein